MCCGQASSKKETRTITAYTPSAPAKVAASSPNTVTANPFVIPKAVKQQLVINQQLARVPKKG